jgi:hypothetical protein
MRSNPEPENAVRHFDTKGAVMQADADAPKACNLLEVQ